MELHDNNGHLSELLAEISASVERICNAETPHQIDKDLLLSQIRDFYATVLRIDTAKEEANWFDQDDNCTQSVPTTFGTTDNQNDATKTEQPAAKETPEQPAIPTEQANDETTVAEPQNTYEKADLPDNQVYYKEIDKENNLADKDFENQQDIESTPIPDVYHEPIDEKKTETEPEPAAKSEPEPQKPSIVDQLINRKNAIEQLVSQQQNISAETHAGAEPEPQRPAATHPTQHSDGHPQLSLLDYLPGVSRVVENVEHQSAPVEPTTPPQPETHIPPQPTPTPAPSSQPAAHKPEPEPEPQPVHITQPTPTPTPKPEPEPAPMPKPTPAPQPQTPLKESAPTLPELRSLIGINDKFTFINDLFEKDMRNYNEFISSLNKICDLGQAQDFVQQNATMHHWDKESMAVQLFMSVFKRRYSSPLILQ